MSRLRFAYAVSGLTVLVIICVAALHLFSVTNCTGPSPDILGVSYKWGINARISVTASNFPSNLQSCVQQAFDNWGSANATANGSGVQFGTVVFGTAVSTTGKTNVYQVTYGTVSGGNAGSTSGQANGSLTMRNNANTTIDTSESTCAQVTTTMSHEIGHTMGLGDCHACSGPTQSVEFPSIPPVTVPPYQTAPTPCDNQTVQSVVRGCLAETFACSAGLPCCVGTVCHSGACTLCESDCPTPPGSCIRCGSSPIILDVNGNGFHLTSAANGVRFDISGSGNPIQMGWTALGADNAFLALPGPDGLVHNGKELFGNFTPQPESKLVNKNGFAALAVYDQPKNGGNGDGVIDAQDAVFASLRLWVDANHDGISQPEELHTLPSQGVNSISLSYREDKKTDQYGNKFRDRAAVNPHDRDASAVGRTAYDVFFVVLDEPTANTSCILPGVKGTTGITLPSGSR